MAEPVIVKCGDCTHFVRDGRCGAPPFGKAPPFWVWSDCYSDKEQVRRDVTSACPAFAGRAALETESPHHD